MKKLLFGCFVAAIAGAGALQAANYSNEVLAIGVGARPLGMGGAFVGLADDSSAVYWNPAGLPQIDHVEVAAVQQGKETDSLNLNQVGSRYTYLSGGWNLGAKVGALGIGFMRFSVDDIPEVSGSLDANGAPIVLGSFKTQDLAFMAGYGKRLFPALSLGAGIKFLTGGTSGITSGDFTYNDFGLDLSALSDLGKLQPMLDGLSVGMNIQDLYNSGVSWSTGSAPESVDVNVKAGLAYVPNWQFLKSAATKLALLFDVDPKYSPNALYHAGAEAWYKDTFALRGGVRIFASGLQRNEMSVGMSVRIYMMQIDYAFVDYELTPVQYLSLSGKF